MLKSGAGGREQAVKRIPSRRIIQAFLIGQPPLSHTTEGMLYLEHLA
jgi:hypothetical protein